jgi:hypothetical protein
MIDKVLEDCRRAHVQINFDKSRLSPSHHLEKHLGFTLDFADPAPSRFPRIGGIGCVKTSCHCSEQPNLTRKFRYALWLAPLDKL